MRICIFSRPFHPAVGGLEQIAKTLAYEFSSANCDVEVVTDTKSLGREDNEFPFKITRTSSFKERFIAFRRADVVLFMNFTFAGVPVAMLARRPIVLSHHGIYRFRGALKTQLVEFAKRQLSRFFLNISVSHFVARNLPGKFIVVPNAFEDRLFHYTPAQRNRDFVFCGRLVSDKGTNVLLDAYKVVLNSYPEATLTIIGDGPELVVLQAQSKSIGLFNNIEFTGTLRGQKLVNKLKEHSCMVIPSLWEEPFGIVALEGIASCDTVISSNRGGLPEAVGDCGILVEPTIDGLAQAMVSVLQSHEKGMLLPGQPTAEQRATHLAKHSAKQVAQRYIEVCRLAINL
jgi:glycosyltransferase involved in cell wall biosynthesis